MTALSKVFLFLVLSAVHVYANADDFTLGEITASRGEQVSGFITVPDGMDEGTTIPVTVVHGAPCTTVTGMVVPSSIPSGTVMNPDTCSPLDAVISPRVKSSAFA